jgi:hypothetical protein
MGVCLLWVLCVVRFRTLRKPYHWTRGGVPTVGVCRVGLPRKKTSWMRKAMARVGSQPHIKKACTLLQLCQQLLKVLQDNIHLIVYVSHPFFSWIVLCTWFRNWIFMPVHIPVKRLLKSLRPFGGNNSKVLGQSDMYYMQCMQGRIAAAPGSWVHQVAK